MTEATELLSELRRRGVNLRPAGDRIQYRPKDALPTELRAAVTRHKAELLMLLATEDPEVRWRADAMRPRVPPTGPIPAMYARRLPAPVPDGCCLSCGEPLTPRNRYNCEPCVRAAWLVLREVRGGDGPDAADRTRN